MRCHSFAPSTLIIFIILLGVHGVVIFVFVVKVVVGVVGQVAQADGDDRGNMGVNFFRAPLTTNEELNRKKQPGTEDGERWWNVLPPDEGLEGLDAVFSELIVVNVTELHHQRNDLLQILSWGSTRTDREQVSNSSYCGFSLLLFPG